MLNGLQPFHAVIVLVLIAMAAVLGACVIAFVVWLIRKGGSQ